MVISALSHLMIILSSDVVIRFFAFLVFEACVGLYFPMIGTLKGDIVPEDMRSTIYNIYRFPLNLVVLLPLLMNFSITTTFIVTTSILVNAAVCQFCLLKMRERPDTNASKRGSGDVEAIVFGNKDDFDSEEPV
eukprot:CAMPEP_0185904498 /NCGR_PEP_ID=MMETSP0196C-20130402/3790_1 /TAXON_ID=2932 /ORGANISM="Alexandrium fundyense, Strain CCMP1719" /LENGTH=133 /DNA_ID=CAMNT_0028623819 /DNA_START=328 /DNA_END=727 /DNA_ORIENTATION=-